METIQRIVTSKGAARSSDIARSRNVAYCYVTTAHMNLTGNDLVNNVPNKMK